MKQKPDVDSMENIRRRDAQWRPSGRDGNGSRAAEDRRILLSQLEEYEQSVDLRWKADMRAIKRWQEAHPGKELTWPDHADLVVWLLGELEKRDATDALSKCVALGWSVGPEYTVKLVFQSLADMESALDQMRAKLAVPLGGRADV